MMTTLKYLKTRIVGIALYSVFCSYLTVNAAMASKLEAQSPVNVM